MLPVQRFLRWGSFTDLAAACGVYASFSGDRRKCSLNYDMIEAREDDALASQCRGLILARVGHTPFPVGEFEAVGETIVVARPFDRFFNHGQNGADAGALLGRTGTRVFEKIDGTLCILYFDAYRGQWCVATRSVPDADRPIDGFGHFTFASLFENALKEHLNLTIERLGRALDPGKTYLFELTTPHNRVVVEHKHPRVHLLGMRDNLTGDEDCPILSPIAGFSVPIAPHYACGTFGELMGLVNDRDPRLSEGVVVRAGESPHFVRVKAKNPEWVALSAVKASVIASPRRLLAEVLLGHGDDLFTLLTPDLAAIGARYTEGIATLRHVHDAAFDAILSTLPDGDEKQRRKAFAAEAQRRPVMLSLLMDRYGGKCASAHEWVDQRKDAKTGTWPDAFLDTLLRYMERGHAR